jgi:hypothetical protein
MPPIADRLQSKGASSGYTPVEAPKHPPVVTSPTITKRPTVSPFMRCPLPPVYSSNPDSLRQWDLGGVVPQNRILTP